LTCPLLTADLLWALNLPYKFTYAGFVAVCIVCAFMATTIPAPAKFMWFGGLFVCQSPFCIDRNVVYPDYTCVDVLHQLD